MRPVVPLLLLLAACHRGTIDVDDTDDDVVIDTNPDVDTDDTDTGDTDTGGDTDTDTGTDWTEITLSPPELWVGTGATFTYRLRATSPDGERTTPDPVAWTVDDGAIASVTDGTVTALAAGAATVTATWDGGIATAVLHVEDGGPIEVTVVDEATGAPISGAEVALDELAIGVTDASGLLTSTGASAGPIAVCAWEDGWVPGCVTGVVGRRVVVGLRAKATDGTGDLTGRVDFSAFSPDASEVAVAVAVPGLAADPWWTTFDDLLGPSRVLTVYGVDVSLPSNVAVDGADPSFSADAAAGDRALWAVATVIPLADALGAGSGSGDPLQLLAQHMSDARWTPAGPFAVPDGGSMDVGTLRPSQVFDTAISVTTGELPAGTAGDEQALVLAISDDTGGWVGTGLGAGVRGVSVAQVSIASAEKVVAIVQAGGFGSGLGISVAVADVVSAGADLPEWTDIPSLPEVWPTDDRIDLATDPDAQVVLMRIVDRTYHERDMVGPAGVPSLGFPEISPPLDRGRTDWELRVVATDARHFEEIVASGPLFRDAIGPETIGTAIVSGEVAASS